MRPSILIADGNGRTGRALALWELYRRGFDTHHIFSVDEFYWATRPRYCKELDAVRKAGDDLSGWLEYCAEGLRQTLERAWLRILTLSVTAPTKLVLRPKQAQLLNLLRDHRSLAPAEIWAALNVSRQGAKACRHFSRNPTGHPYLPRERKIGDKYAFGGPRRPASALSRTSRSTGLPQ